MTSVPLAVALCLAASSAPTGAPAPAPAPVSLETVGVEVRWSAPADCPDGEAMLAMVAEVVGRKLRIDATAARRVEGTIVRQPSGYALELTIALRGEAQPVTRHFEAPRCDAVVEAGSLVVATRLLVELEARAQPGDPRVPLSPVAAEPASEPASEPPSEHGAPATVADDDPPPAEPTTSSRAARSRSSAHRQPGPPRVGLLALAGAAYGAQPGVAGTLGGGVALLLDGGRVELHALHGFATRSRAVDGSSVRVAATVVDALGCWAPAIRRLDVPVCAGLELGALVGEGQGELSRAVTSRQLSVAIPVHVALAWAVVPRFALRLGLGAAFALRPPGFHVRTPGGVDDVRFRAGPVAIRGLAGFEVRIP